MELTERHKQAILKMFVDSVITAKNGDRKKLFSEFEETFMDCFENLYDVVDKALIEHNASDEIIEEWSDYGKEKRECDNNLPVEFCPMVLEDEEEITHLLRRELNALVLPSDFMDTGTIREFSQTGYSFVVKSNGAIIGVMMAQKMLELGNDVIYINDFAVDGDFQGKGIGKQMLEHLKDIIREDCKCDTVQIFLCTDRNRKAYDIYHKLGFSDQSSSAVYMHKYLGTGYSLRKAGLD